MNDRLDDSYTLTFPAAATSRKATRSRSATANTVTFQFIDQCVAGGNPYYVPVAFYSGETAADVAAAIVTAINGADTSGLFKVTAATNGNPGDLVDLFSAATVTTAEPATNGGRRQSSQRPRCTAISRTISTAT